ncbi:MAG: flagellar hook-associated protein FlgK [Butyrivibrio sp.]|nr:flagellar hook-associated protein FlgK [Muribaculum sp.]MCM1551352.1 flagellar hook-associated protein FlgK [Butyrivibrio sp.]
MSLMSSLYIGTSGLQTSQNALNTTAHNLSNIDTVGYSRQQVQQADRSYVTLKKTLSGTGVSDHQYGLGTTYSRVKQIRDYFLDKTYRKESGRSMFYEVSSNVLEEVETQLGEFNGKAFQQTMKDFWESVQELCKDPANSVTQGVFVRRSSEFVERAAAIYDGLSSYQDNLNLQVKQQVEKINKYGNQLLELNDKIRSIESGGIEKANDLRDTRNQILDELAELAKISFKEDELGNVSVQIEGVDFVKGELCHEMSLYLDEATGFYTPFWPLDATFTKLDDGSRLYNIDGAEVFDLSIEISSDLDTDIGGLKAMLLARGDHRADYTDMAEGKYDSVSQSVIMNIQAEFDQLVHNVVTKINGILAEAAGVTTGDLELEDGTILEGVRYCEDVEGGYMRNDNGSPIQMFEKITTDEYTKVKGSDGKEYWVYNEENTEDPSMTETLYTLRNLEINKELMQKPARLGFRLSEHSEDQETVDKLKAAFTEEIYTLNPNVKKKTTFNDYYSDMVSQVANSGYVYRSIYESQQVTVEAAESARAQVIGVSSDEELSYMIKFQNAYNASSRYINAISEMLEHVINRLGA